MAKRAAAKGADFISAVLRGRARPQRVTVVAGYLGASALPGHTRIYTSLDLQHWVDVRRRDVVHAAAEGEGPWARTLHWVKVNAPVTYGSTVVKDWKGRMGGVVRDSDADRRTALLAKVQEECDTSLSETCRRRTVPTFCVCPSLVCPEGPDIPWPVTRRCPEHGDH